MSSPAYTFEGHQPRVVFEDPKAPHQIVLSVVNSGMLTVSCTCLVRGKHAPLAGSRTMNAPESLGIWQGHRDRAERGGI